MRGALGEPQLVDFLKGIIPAHAGSTCPAFSAARTSWDHPRACGEHNVVSAIKGAFNGSSPRMRGAHYSSYRLDCHDGIIPAHAGSTNKEDKYRA